MNRQHLTNAIVRRLPLAERGQYVVRDATLPGFHVVVGRRTRTFTLQVDIRALGRRKTVKQAIGRVEDWDCADARKEARARIGALQTGARTTEPKGGRLTLGMAWEAYRVNLERRGRSPRTIEGYQDSIERLLKGWRDTPLRLLAEAPLAVQEEHRRIAEAHGPYAANRAISGLRAVYNYARRRRLEPGLTAEGPADAVEWCEEERRNTGMSLAELPAWHAQRLALPNPIRQEWHLFMLLSGSRPDALRRARWEHLDLARRVLHFPNPKGGTKRAFDMPLSRQMLRSLCRVRRAGRILHTRACATWIFPADTPTGHIAETKERRDRLAKFGSDLRQTYRTTAAALGMDDTSIHLLMNHKLSGVSAGYITQSALLDHLRAQQERISTALVPDTTKGCREGAQVV